MNVGSLLNGVKLLHSDQGCQPPGPPPVIEERSDEAISTSQRRDRFAALAMTLAKVPG
jgi:hypothetical protein